MRSVSVLCLIAALCGSAAAQSTVWVDGRATPPGSGTSASPFVTIQDGIVAAIPGDTVRIAPGTYAETIDFLGKAITVRGAGASRGVRTVIDGGGLGPVVSFVGGEGPGSILDGVLLIRGDGTSGPTGGGIHCDGASPTITNCTVRRCRGGEGRGGGLHVVDGSPKISGCVITGNTGAASLDPMRPGGAGGVHVEGALAAPVLSACFITANRGEGAGGLALYDGSLSVSDTVIEGNSGGDGAPGGLLVRNATGTMTGTSIVANTGGPSLPTAGLAGGAGGLAADGAPGGVLISECDITGNRGGDAAPGAYPAGPGGLSLFGDVTLENSTVTGNAGGSDPGGLVAGGVGGAFVTGRGRLEACDVSSNHGGAGDPAGAGGVFLRSVLVTDAPALLGCRVRENVAGEARASLFGGRGGHGGVAVTVSSGTAAVDSCLIAGNRASAGTRLDGGAGGIHVASFFQVPIVFRHLTIVDNRGGDVAIPAAGIGSPGVGGLAIPATASLLNSVVWGNRGGADDDIRQIEAADVSYSNVMGGAPGPGNIDISPGFVSAASGDYHLELDSPCRDAGADGPALPRIDFDAEPRLYHDSLPDIGADEYFVALQPGSGEDLVLTTTVAPSISPLPDRHGVGAGQTYELTMTSPNGGFVGETAVIMGQLYSSGGPAPQDPVFPELHIDSASGAMPIVLYGQQIGDPPSLPPGGVTVSIVYPGGMLGMTLNVQGLVYPVVMTPANGTFAATNAHALVLGDGVPTAVATALPEICPEDAGSLSSAGSTDPEGGPLSHAWRQIAGPPVVILDPQSAVTTFVPVPGVFEFEVTVGDGVTFDTDRVTVIANRPPQAVAQAVPTTLIGQTVALDGSRTVDPDGLPLSYLWTQTSGDAVTLLAFDQVFAFFSATTSGIRTFELAVDDGHVVSTATVTVDVVPSLTVDIAPIFSAGVASCASCHGVEEAVGLTGKLDLTDPMALHRELTVEPALEPGFARRLSLASPAASLLLRKAAGELGHPGGAFFTSDDPVHDLILRWITAGAPDN